MKFAQLGSPSRSILTALAASNNLTTDQLANACCPKKTPKEAANELCGLRALGLVYSMQKPDSKPYASWAISAVGKAVFEGRPDGDVVITPDTGPCAPSISVQSPRSADDLLYVVKYGDDATPGSRWPTEELAITEAQRYATTHPGKKATVLRVIAISEMPVPQATVTRL